MKTWILFLSTLFLALLFSACSQPAAPRAPTAAPTQLQPTAAPTQGCSACSATAAAKNAAKTTITPLSMEVCDGQAQAMSHYLDVVEVTQSEAPMSDPVTGASGSGCQAAVTGDGVKFKSPDAVVKTLGGMLEEQGFVEDPMLAADGPTGTSRGYRKGDQVCYASAGWQPDASANCPSDQPISACQVKPEQQNYTVTLLCGEEKPGG